MKNESQQIQVDPRNIHYKRNMSPPVHINNVQLPPRRCQVSWATPGHLAHIFTKWKQLGITLTKIYWLLGNKSKLSTSNKLII
jgi:hypothetical protein